MTTDHIVYYKRPTEERGWRGGLPWSSKRAAIESARELGKLGFCAVVNDPAGRQVFEVQS